MMGLEPTTFCMAKAGERSRGFARVRRNLRCAACGCRKIRFRLQTVPLRRMLTIFGTLRGQLEAAVLAGTRARARPEAQIRSLGHFRCDRDRVMLRRRGRVVWPRLRLDPFGPAGAWRLSRLAKLPAGPNSSTRPACIAYALRASDRHLRSTKVRIAVAFSRQPVGAENSVPPVNHRIRPGSFAGRFGPRCGRTCFAVGSSLRFSAREYQIAPDFSNQ
jgi:hypothetical protein